MVHLVLKKIQNESILLAFQIGSSMPQKARLSVHQTNNTEAGMVSKTFWNLVLNRLSSSLSKLEICLYVIKSSSVLY